MSRAIVTWMRGMLRRIRQKLENRLGAIPPDTKVDPSEFPEAEYPVKCLKCGYALFGLLDGQCPECGQDFSRGHLLVETYVRGRITKNDLRNRAHRWLFAMFVTSQIVALGFALFLHVAPEFARKIIGETNVFYWVVSLAILKGVGWLALLGDIILALATMPSGKKRLRVLEAVRREL